ncbi:MAG: hypothetical protein C0402_05555 [Thermodesulfovibrio sp.]|nr:hypothetical protein [Thermodesulfovibrio sp.]
MKIVYSTKLKEQIVIASCDGEASIIRAFGRTGGRVVYTKAEADMLVGRPLELILLCHEAKKIFNGTILAVEKTLENS